MFRSEEFDRGHCQPPLVAFPSSAAAEGLQRMVTRPMAGRKKIATEAMETGKAFFIAAPKRRGFRGTMFDE